MNTVVWHSTSIDRVLNAMDNCCELRLITYIVERFMFD